MNKFNIKKIKILLPLLFLVSCQTSEQAQLEGHYKRWKKFAKSVTSEQRSLSYFNRQGPFKTKTFKNHPLYLSLQTKVILDLYKPQLKNRSPLIIMIHGNKFNKEVHSHQCSKLASWGFHCISLELPNTNQWIKNGKKVKRITKLIHKIPGLLSKNIDKNKIILIGHSFGGSAATIAAGSNAPTAGLILLDPAVVHPIVKKYMRRIDKPVVLIGADPNVFKSKKRYLFFKNIKGSMTEVTVRGATHNDAQSPSITALTWGIDPFTTTDHQNTFLSSIIASAFSISVKNNTLFAYRSFTQSVKNGVLAGLKNKPRHSLQ